MKRAIVLALVTAIAAFLAASAVARPTAVARTDAQQAVSCKGTLKIALVTPLTGGAGFLGQEQLSWAKLAIKTLAPDVGLKVKLVPGDAPVEQGPSRCTDGRAEVRGQQEHGRRDRRLDVGFGRGHEQDVQRGRHGAHLVVGDAHDADEGRQPGRHEVVLPRRPGDDFIQGPTDAKYMVDVLKVKNVVIIDFQEPYSQGLAGEVENVLKGAERRPRRGSRSRTRTTDFSSLVTKVPSDADIVFFPTQKPGDAQAFASAAARAGQEGEGLRRRRRERSGRFKAPGGYVSNFAPQIDAIADDKAIIAAGRRTTRARRSAPSGRRPTAPSRSAAGAVKAVPATRARAPSPSAAR